MDSLSQQEHQLVQRLCLEFEKGDDQAKQVFIRDQLDDIFNPYYIQWRLLPKQVGIHPLNRDQDMMTASGVWIRGSRILASGFSFKAAGKLWAFEDHPVKKHIELHTIATSKSDPGFASFSAGDVKVGPANWTHSNQFVNMVVQGTPCTHKDIPCVDGRIDTEKICKDPKQCRMLEYIKQGMVFNVFPYWVEEQYPLVPKIFQSACSQEQQVQQIQGEGWTQLLKKVSNKAAEIVLSGKTASNDDIAKAVLRSQPPHAIDVPDMVDYNQKWGGGSSQFFVNDVLHFCQAYKVPPTVHVSGRIFKALASLDFGAHEMPATAVNAVLKRVAASEKIVDGVASDYKVSDISAFCSNKNKKALFLEADKVMRNCNEILCKNNIAENDRTLHAGWLQISLIDLISGKTNKDGRTFADIEAITKAFLERVFAEEKGSGRTVEDARAPASTVVVNYDEHGAASNVPKLLLQNKGFAAGSKYTNKKDKDLVWQLLSIDGDGKSKLQAYTAFGELGETTLEVAAEELAHNFKPWDGQFSFLAKYPRCEGKYSQQLSTDVLIGRVRDCLLTLASSLPDYDLSVRTSPSRGVFCKGQSIDSLVLSPTGGSITTKKSTSAGQQYTCTMVGPQVIAHFVLNQSAASEELCSAFFMVQHTDNEDKANVKLAHKEVVFIPPATGKLKIAGHEHTLKIPCYVNTKTIEYGQEIVYYKKKEEKSESAASVPGLKFQMGSAPLKRPRK